MHKVEPGRKRVLLRGKREKRICWLCAAARCADGNYPCFEAKL
jgi:hypothetical protein